MIDQAYRMAKQAEVFSLFPNYRCPENPDRGNGPQPYCSLELLGIVPTINDEGLIVNQPVIICCRLCLQKQNKNY